MKCMHVGSGVFLDACVDGVDGVDGTCEVFRCFCTRTSASASTSTSAST